MNKIFKIVFNAARGKMMVVNEATSSVQTGKKAAVTVAVISALASGVAVAAEEADFTGGPYYPTGTEVTITDRIDTQKVSGAYSSAIHAAAQNASNITKSTLTVTNSLIEVTDSRSNWALYGGTRITGSGAPTVASAGDSEVTLTDVTGHLDVYGAGTVRNAGVTYTANNSTVTATNVVLNGHYDSTAETLGGTAYPGAIYGAGYLTAASTMSFKETKVVATNVSGSMISTDDVEIGGARVYGGGYLYNVTTAGAVLDIEKSSVEVNGDKTELQYAVGGSITSGSANVGTVKAGLTSVTVNDGHVKVAVGGHFVNYYGNAEVTGTSKVVINGGKVDTVVGGTYMNFGAEGDFSGESARSSEVMNSVVEINGGEVGTVIGGSHADIAAGDGVNLLAVVTEHSSITIENAVVTGDVIGGGLAEGQGASMEVKDVSVEIKDSSIEKGALVTTESITKDGGKAVDTSSASVTLTNVDASEAKVESKVGTVTLVATNGKTTSIGELAVAEDVELALKADGDSNDAAAGDITKAIQIGDGSTAGATVEMAEGMHQGAVTGTVNADGKAEVTQATNSVMSNTLDLASSAPLAMNRLLMNDVRKRMGDLRAAEGTHGVWARYDGGKLSGANGLENDFTTVQVGMDTVPVVDAPRFGVAFAYTKSDADMKRGGAEMDAFSLAFYGTKFYDNGMFVDVIGRMATADTDVNVEGKTGTMDNVALSLSGEFGWRFDVNDQFYVEPQAELTYTYVNADTLKLSSGHEYAFDSVDSLMARVGFAAGFKCPSNFGDVYVRASAVHEFLGDSTVRGGSAIHTVDGKDTWVEFGLGANFNVNKNTYVYVDIERTEGAKLEEDWRANVGVRYAF